MVCKRMASTLLERSRCVNLNCGLISTYKGSLFCECCVEARLRWFGPVIKNIRDGAARKKGKSPEKIMDVLKVDMEMVGLRVEEARDGVRWRKMIHCGDP